MNKSTVSRVAYFTNQEQAIILDKYKEVKLIIQAKSKTVEAAKCRKDSWQKKELTVNA